MVAVEKDRYPDIVSGIAAVVRIYITTLLDTAAARGIRTLYVHPVPPVLNETRALVKQFNGQLKKAVRSAAGPLQWLDFFSGLLTEGGAQLRPEFKLDGTHMHPCYLRLVAAAIDAAEDRREAKAATVQ